jgi:hypothetical protein
MGEAKRRGTFEERREQALVAGRVKKSKLARPSGANHDSFLSALMRFLRSARTPKVAK